MAHFLKKGKKIFQTEAGNGPSKKNACAFKGKRIGGEVELVSGVEAGEKVLVHGHAEPDDLAHADPSRDRGSPVARTGGT